MKIIVVGTPKTGNTWLKHLLADVYNLPIVTLGPVFSEAEAEAAGQNWISHQHYLPKHALMTWAKAHDAIFVSVVRHPADVLISLWHHSKKGSGRSSVAPPASTLSVARLSEGEEVNSEPTVHFVQHDFASHLNLSIAWSAVPGALTVRYEDLWTQPLETLARLTAAIAPRPEESLKLSLCACGLGLMQSLLDPEKNLIRKGGTGAWMTLLSPTLKHLLATRDPYPAQFAKLGYTMDESDPANVAHPSPGRVEGPFSAQRHFDDGTPITPVLMRAYFDLAPTLRARWPAPTATASESFYSWLSLPAAADPGRDARHPLITELAYHIYQHRPDVRKAFPDPFGANRGEFCEWFFFDARKEYSLPDCFLRQNPFVQATCFSDGTPISRVLVRAHGDSPPDLRQSWGDPLQVGSGSYLSWLKSPAKADPDAAGGSTTVTELGAYLHSIRPDLNRLWPDLYGAHRVDFSDWFLSSAAHEYQLDPSLIAPVAASWAQGMGKHAGTFTDGTPIVHVLTRVYLSLPKALRARWPDPTNAGPGSYLAWLTTPAEADPAAGTTAPIVTELGAYLYSIRGDVRALMPDLYGEDRVDFADWFVSSAVNEYGLDSCFVIPVMLSWATAEDTSSTPHVLAMTADEPSAR